MPRTGFQAPTRTSHVTRKGIYRHATGGARSRLPLRWWLSACSQVVLPVVATASFLPSIKRLQAGLPRRARRYRYAVVALTNFSYRNALVDWVCTSSSTLWKSTTTSFGSLRGEPFLFFPFAACRFMARSPTRRPVRIAVPDRCWGGNAPSLACSHIGVDTNAAQVPRGAAWLPEPATGGDGASRRSQERSISSTVPRAERCGRSRVTFAHLKTAGVCTGLMGG